MCFAKYCCYYRYENTYPSLTIKSRSFADAFFCFLYRLLLLSPPSHNHIFTLVRTCSCATDFDTGAASPAYEKKEYKARCTLCRMWFEKSSVSYKVSNHRLIGLRQQHGEIESGRRYTNASYMYRFVNVCVFCSQLFDEEYKVSKKPEDVLTLPPKKEPVVKTELLRMNIAPNHRCYMSSVVDNLTAERALSRAVSINGNNIDIKTKTMETFVI